METAELDSVICQLASYSRRHDGPKSQLAGLASKYLGLRKEFGRVYEGMLADPLLQEIIEESRLEIACGWRPPTVELLTIYCDGCCVNNGREGARAGYGIYATNEEGEELFGRGFRVDPSEPQTNQRSELRAMFHALAYGLENANGRKIQIYSDSRYAIDCLTKWASTWEVSGWLKSDNKPVLHADLIKLCLTHYKELGSRVTLHHINSHTGGTDSHSKGNAIADRYARNGAMET